jgi:uncharacterized protein YdeI (YjbR/CyaY-like superfamily)
MVKINPNANNFIDQYIENLPSFSNEICSTLRTIIHKTDVTIIEDWKWNIPIFHTNKMICGFAAFKNHVSLTFFNGVEMSDQHHLFSFDCNAQKTRTIKFEVNSKINKAHLLDYFKESFFMKESNIKKKSEIKEIEIPELLKIALEKNKVAKTNFENMAFTYKKEYALHISNAKREATKISRLEKVISYLEQNIKMHEQYKC